MFGEMSVDKIPSAETGAAPGGGELLSPLQIWRRALGLYWRHWPEYTALAAVGYGLLVLLALVFAGFYRLLAASSEMLLPLILPLAAVGGLLGVGLIHLFVLTALAQLVLTPTVGQSFSLAQTLRQARRQSKNLLIVVVLLLAAAAVVVILAGIPVVGWLIAPGVLVYLGVLGSLAPAALVAEGLPGAWAIARMWGLARPHFWRCLLAVGGMLAAGLLIFALPTVTMLALGLPLQFADLWLPLLLGLFFTPIFGATTALTYANLRQHSTGPTPPQTLAQLYRPVGQTGLVSVAELGQFALLSVATVAFTALFVAAGYSGAFVASATIDQAAAQEAVGRPAPDFLLDGLDGASMSLGQLKGKPSVINFWATWCRPCKEELPVLQQSYLQNGSRVNFLAISVKEERDTVAAFVQAEALELPVVLDFNGAVVNDYLVRGLPTTIILDADGVIVARHLGGVTQESLAAYLAPLLAAE